MSVADVRNLAVLGHIGSGKTTFCEALAQKAGIITKQGSVDAGTSVCDYTPEEIQRKTTMYAKPLSGTCKTKSGKPVELTVTDTPGVDDFAGHVIMALKVSDAAIIVIDAASGIQVGTNKAWRKCADSNIPKAIIVTGLDKENTSFDKTLAEIQGVWGNSCVPFAFPTSDMSGVVDVLAAKDIPDDLSEKAEAAKGSIIEFAAEADDALLEKYLGGESLAPEEIAAGLRAVINDSRLTPVFPMIAPKDIGLDEFIENLARFFPSPVDRKHTDAEGNVIDCSENGPFVGLVWRTATDPYAGKLAYMRIFGGTLKGETEVLNCSKGQKERLTGYFYPNGKTQAQIDEALPGRIVALPKLKATELGDVLCAPGHTVTFTPFEFPEPVVSYAVSAKERSDEDKIGTALSRVAGDDPTLRVERNSDTHELVISGMGETHMEVAIELMKKRGNVDVELKTPRVPYRETVTSTGEGHYKHKKQSGGRGQYGEVYCRVSPKQPEEEWFENAIVGGVIPKNFIPACEKGFLEAMPKGAQAGFKVVDVKVTLYDGSYHDVDSSEIAFKIAAGRAFREAMMKANPVLLEPVMSLKVVIPEQFMGDINSDLNQKRGRILGVNVEDGFQVIVAEAPYAELFRYCSELRSMTGGRGFFEMKFCRYEIVPGNVAQKVIAAAQSDLEHEND